ncbi:SdrD B-like domain-containing protein [Pseudoalteromonas sp. SS15]|uniref:SdrD B-like domain-containing protein n=1 Tax=Pseudoalteromonas sp. SS15 TaxID=3139393 RepID=UPI003BADB159
MTLTGKDKFGRAVSLTRTTDTNGQYAFENLVEANADGYSVAATLSGNTAHENGKDYLKIGANRTESDTANSTVNVPLSGTNKSATVDFTEKLKPVGYSIAGKVFLDTLQDGELEAAELDKVLESITVTLTGKDKFGRAVSLTRTTDTNGQYAFENLVEANKGGYSVAATFSGNTAHENGKDYLNIGANRTESNTVNSTVKVDLTDANKSATVDFTEKLKPVNFEVSGRVFLDTLQDGELETAELDKALENITITLTGKDKFGRDVLLTRTTDVNGQYTFADLTEANADGYSVTATQSGLANHLDGKDYLVVGGSHTESQTASNTVVVGLTAATRSATVDFTEQLEPESRNISGRVFLDTLQDGELEVAELDKALENITITLTGKDKFGRAVSHTQVTKTDGTYTFTGLIAANDAGYTVTAAQSGIAKQLNGQDYLILGAAKTASNTADNSVIVALSGNTETAGVDFTEMLADEDRRISGRVFLDTQQDGELEAAELDKALENITVTLTGNDIFGRSVSRTQTTQVDGTYTFTGLTAANDAGYKLHASSGSYVNGKDYLTTSGVTTTSDMSDNTVLVKLSGSNEQATVDFTELPKAGEGSITGRVFFDAQQDGELEAAELDKPLSAVSISLVGRDIYGRTVTLQAQTNELGQFNFANLTAANDAGYTVTAGSGGFSNGLDYLTIARSTTQLDAGNNAIVVKLTESTLAANIDFTEQPNDGAKTIRGSVFVDTEQDGQLEAAKGDTALTQVIVTLAGRDQYGREVNQTAQTDVQGGFEFTRLHEADSTGYVITHALVSPYRDGFDYQDGARTAKQPDTEHTHGIRFESQETVVYDMTERLPANDGVITGQLIVDVDQNGRFDEQDIAIADAKITLTGKDLLARDVSLSVQTDAQGRFEFTQLFASNNQGYQLAHQQVAPYLDGLDYLDGKQVDSTDDVIANITITAASRTSLLLTEQLPENTAKISGRVFVDIAQNGVFEAQDVVLPQVTLQLSGLNVLGQSVSLTTQTDEQGDFSFEQLYASDAAGYQVSQVQPAQYIDGADYLNTQRISEQNDLISDLVLNAGQQQTSLIFTEQFNELGSIAAQVYLDADQNGVPSDIELGLPAVTVTLVGTDIYGREVSLEQPTNEQGIVKFEGLAASDTQGYVLTQSQPEGYFDGKESDQGVVLAENNDQISITLASEQQRTGLAFAELEAGSIAGHVYVDSDNSGTFANDADRAIAYVTLTLKGNDLFGQPLERQVQTDIDGAYQFTGLPPSDGNGYQVSQAQPEFYLDGLDYIAGVVVENSTQTDVIYVGVLKSAQQINNIDFTEAYGLAVMGYVFVDKQDQGVLTLADDMSEIAIANSEITLTGYDYRGQSVEMTTTTDENGQYRFEKLAPSDEQGYAISQTTQPSDYIDGSESFNEEVFANSKGRDDIFTVELKELQTFGMYNFAELPRASLAGAVYVDSNEDGVLNDSEQLRVGNVEITLEGTTLEGEAVNLTVRTDEQGEYLFDYLRPGQYSITQTQPSAWLDGEEQLGSLGGEVGQDTFTNINLELGVKGSGYYFAERGSHLSGTVYVDLNDNGTQESNELGLANTQLFISGTDLDGQPVQREVLTDGYGRYQFKQLPLSGGEGFTITETQPENTQDGLDSIGSIGGVQEQNDELKHIQIIEHITHAVDYNFGEQLMDPASISGLVWLDKNHNRAKDDNNGQSGWIVELLLDPQTGEANPLDAEPLATTTSDENGRYTFAGLPVGTYEIRFRHPQGGVIYGTPVTDDPDASSEKGTILNLRLSAGEEVDNQSLPIDPSGVVYDAQTRKPIQGAIVKIIGPAGFEPDLHLVGGSANVEQTTAEDGFYQFLFFAQAPTGIYRLEVTEPVGYLAGGSTQIPVCENTLTAGASELPILVHFEEQVPQLDAPIHDPSACVAHSDQITQNNTSTQYYQSFYIDPKLPSGNVVNNHIPLDPYGDDMVQVSKTALKQDVVIGELVPYQISYKNRSSETLAPLSLIDQLPAGLKYVPGSARVDGFVKEPEVLGRVLRWHSYSLAPEQVINIELMVVVGSGVSQGTYINQAWSEFIGGQHSLDSGWRISNIATAAVRVIPDPVFDCSDLSGKVFNDLNRNGYQDGDEKGLPAVRLATAQGLWITTDEHGRYHLACADIPNAVRGSNFIVKVDERSLPSGVRIVSENPRVVRLTRGKSQKVDFAANIHRVARIQLTPSAFVENQLADDYKTRLVALLDALDTRPTVIRVAYQAEPSLQTDQQLNNLKHWLSEQAELRDLQLTIETEMTPVAIPTLSSLTKETSHD